MATAAAAAVPDGRRGSKGARSSSSPMTTAIMVIGVLVSARWITTTVSAESILSWIVIGSLQCNLCVYKMLVVDFLFMLNYCLIKNISSNKYNYKSTLNFLNDKINYIIILKN
jgi:hypothetical protein